MVLVRFVLIDPGESAIVPFCVCLHQGLATVTPRPSLAHAQYAGGFRAPTDAVRVDVCGTDELTDPLTGGEVAVLCVLS